MQQYSKEWLEWNNWFEKKKNEYNTGKIQDEFFYRQLRQLNSFFKNKTSVTHSLLPTFEDDKKITYEKTPEEIYAENMARQGFTFCKYCGEYKKTLAFFCPDCNQRLEDNRARKIALTRNKLTMIPTGRPLGLTIIYIILIYGVITDIIGAISFIANMTWLTGYLFLSAIVKTAVLEGL